MQGFFSNIAMVHSGMCAEQVNDFLTTLNVPAVSNRMLTERLQEAGETIEETAKESIHESLLQESQLQME